MKERRTPLGTLLRNRREALGYSRTRLGQLAGVPPGTIEGWELGRVAKPPVHDVLRVARALGVSAEEIERAVLEGDAREPPADDDPAGGAVLLLEQAIALFGWDDAQAAAALQATAAQVRAWRTGRAAMTLPQLMTVAALIGLHAAGVAGAGANMADAVASLAQPSGSPPRSRAR
jgi:transcriptional regulator with XRE-family HTH domain